MKKTIIAIMLVLVLLPSVLAFFPVTHKYMDSQLKEEFQGTSDLYNDCMKHPDLCYVGNVLTDISVVYYFTEGFKYEITHSPGFCVNMMERAITDEEKACAVGACLHASQDLTSHQVMVPSAILKSGLPNNVIHTFAEQKIDNYINKISPNTQGDVVTLGQESWDKCIPLLKKVLQENYVEYESDINSGKLDKVINTFIAEVQHSVTGYDISFQGKNGFFGTIGVLTLPILLLYIGSMFLFGLLSGLLIFRKNKSVLNWISLVIFFFLFAFLLFFMIQAMRGQAFVTFVSVIKPISNIAPIGNIETHVDNAINNGLAFFTQGESWIIGKDASGFDTLRAADGQVKWITYLLVTIVLTLLGGLIYLNFRRKGKKSDNFGL